MYCIRWFSFSLLLILLAVEANGQPPQRGRGRGFFGPRGAVNDWVYLVSLREVRDELSIDEQQGPFLDALQEDVRDQQRAAFAGGIDESSDERDFDARAERFQAHFQKLSEASEKLIHVILEPQQMTRLEQLRLQYEGVRAFDRDAFVAALGLTEDQRELIAELRGSTPATPRTADRQALQEQEVAIRAILTEEQNVKWHDLQGDRFTFPERPRRFRRRG